MLTISPTLYTKLYQDIVDFRNTFQLPVNEPEKFSLADDELHDKLYLEETIELSEADTQVSRMDAIVDSAYVLMGRLVHLGYRNLAQARAAEPARVFALETLLNVCSATFKNEVFLICWQEIHASNLSKACKTEQERDDTIRSYKKLKVPTVVEECNGLYLIKVAEDVTIKDKHYPKGKVLKNAHYKAADLVSLV